ncbi:MAG: transaldolase, partial [Anaerolineae bacterium]
MSKLQELAQLGQSIWLDYIRRSFIQSGDFATLIAQGLRGVTSNPTIFEKAIAGSNDYDDAIRARLNAGKPVQSVTEELFVEDIAQAADLLLPVYQATDGLDGYVSLEVSPTLAHDTAGTIAEARRLFSLLGRPNVMIKVPATPEGLPAIETLIREGVNVNVTLIFSVEQYAAVAEAFLRGLERRAQAGQELHRVASVASFFVSRLDTLVDAELERLGRTELAGQAGISAARLVYERFLEIFQGPRWEALAKLGARPQRPLWASTGTKNPLYPDTMYVDNLIAPQTVNTLPPATLQAFLDHGTVAIGIDEARIVAARRHVQKLAEAGIDLTAVGQKLLADGVRSFAASYESLLQSLEEKRRRLRAGICATSSSLGGHPAAVAQTLASLE